MQTPPVFTQLHLGLGSFHRAHQAMYLQQLWNMGDTRWQIIAGTIRPDMPSLLHTLQEQRQYTLETITPLGEIHYQSIHSIRSVIPWDRSMDGLKQVAIQESTKIISFTVTEAGYYLDEQHQLDKQDAIIKQDIAGHTIDSIYAAITHLLRARMQHDSGPVTLLNCDNLRNNGTRFYDALLAFVKEIDDPALLTWIQANTSAPNSMVDRITPKPTPDIAKRVLDATGYVDAAPVMAEHFSQWVIEDNFITERPAWEKVGVELVSNVLPYEEAKIRLLNASHTCIAFASILLGLQYIHEGMRNVTIYRLAHQYITHSAIPCLKHTTPTQAIDLFTYRDSVLSRFSNPYILDTNQRVAMDTYAKIPGFILPTIRECIQHNHNVDAVVIVPALFLTFLLRLHKGMISFDYEDQAMPAQQLDHIALSNDPVFVFANDHLLFKELAGNEQLLHALYRMYQYVNNTFPSA